MDPTKLLPWEEGRIAPADDKKLGKFRNPILRLLHRDASKRVTARQFSEDVQGLFSDNQDSIAIPAPPAAAAAAALAPAPGAPQSSEKGDASGGLLRPNSSGLRTANNPLTL